MGNNNALIRFCGCKDNEESFESKKDKVNINIYNNNIYNIGSKK